MSEPPILRVRGLKTYFRLGGNQILKAVEHFTADIRQGETFGLVGESGCGKSTAGKTIMGLYRATAGEVLYNGADVQKLKGRELKAFRRSVQMVFQDPYASLNPRMSIGDIIAEGIDIHRLYTGSRRKERVYELLRSVGLQEAHAARFPHECSGGQRQRVGIARALAVEPRLLIADEPISALDVSVQAQVVNLFKRLQREQGLTYLFIAHDLAMVKHISDRIGVMYLGHLVEVAPADELCASPLHPYTASLLAAVPLPDPRAERARERMLLQGEAPSPLDPPSGCPFRSRCPQAQPDCAAAVPPLREAQPGRWVACHLV